MASSLAGRIGVTLTVLVLVFALFAVFGTGTEDGSRATPGSSGILRLDYSSVAHFNQPTTVHVHLTGGAVPAGIACIWVQASFLQRVEMRKVSPQPLSVEAEPDRLVYVFRVDDPSRPSSFDFELAPSEVGSMRGRFGLLTTGDEVQLEQFVER